MSLGASRREPATSTCSFIVDAPQVSREVMVKPIRRPDQTEAETERSLRAARGPRSRAFKLPIRLIVLAGNEMTAPVNVSMLLAYVVVAMLFDWGDRGRVHAAYWWGVAALVAMAGLTELLAVAPLFAELANRIAS